MTTPTTPAKATALNIGSGPGNRPSNANFLFVDATAWPVDVAAKIQALPFRDGWFAHVHCAHVIEHVDLEDAPQALAELRRVLDRDGVLYISAPDMDRARAAHSSEWINLTKRGGARPGWEHHWVCTTRKLRKMLIEAGFVPTWAVGLPTGFPLNTHTWPLDFEARFMCRRDDYPWPRSFPSGVQVVL